jgi:hypothetical protein
MPLPLKSKILGTPGSFVTQMTLKCFHYEFERWICRPLSWYNMNCLEFVIILLPVPKVNKLSVPIFWRKKEILPLMGGKFFFSTEEKCYLMGWGEFGVKSKDIVARVGLAREQKTCRGCWRGAPTPPSPPWWHQVLWLQGLFLKNFCPRTPSETCKVYRWNN